MGTTNLDEVNEELKLNLEAESDVESIGGYVVEKLGHIPKVGEKFSEKGIEFYIKGVDENRVTYVIIDIKRRSRSARNGRKA